MAVTVKKYQNNSRKGEFLEFTNIPFNERKYITKYSNYGAGKYSASWRDNDKNHVKWFYVMAKKNTQPIAYGGNNDMNNDGIMQAISNQTNSLETLISSKMEVQDIKMQSMIDANHAIMSAVKAHLRAVQNLLEANLIESSESPAQEQQSQQQGSGGGIGDMFSAINTFSQNPANANMNKDQATQAFMSALSNL